MTPAERLIAKIRGVNRYDPHWVDSFVKIADGRSVKRDKVSFLLKPDLKHKEILHASDRAYKVDANGSLRRIGVKMSEADRRLRKHERSKERRAANARQT